MSALSFAVTLIALLFAPGPTNTLLAVGGASAGFRPAVRLTAGVVVGYLLVVTPLALIGGPYLHSHPVVATVVKLAAAAWVVYLAIGLWRQPLDAAGQLVTLPRIFVTTILNPKGLVIGLAVLPAVDGFANLLPWLAAFLAIVIAASLAWIAAGSALGRMTEGGLPTTLRRGAAGYLGLVALGMVASAI